MSAPEVVLGFTAGLFEGGVGVEIETAATQEQLIAGEGLKRTLLLSPQAAIDLGQALIERGELAAHGDAPVS